MRLFYPALFLGVLGALGGCGKEAGRVPFSSDGEAAATMQLGAGDVSFWTDIELGYEGDARLTYAIDLLQDGAPVATATCDPLGDLPIKTRWVATNIGKSHSRRGMGKMRCEAKLARAGATTVKARLAWAPKPATSTFTKADLVVKQ